MGTSKGYLPIQRPEPWIKIVRLVHHALDDAGYKTLNLRRKSGDVADYLVYEQERADG